MWGEIQDLEMGPDIQTIFVEMRGKIPKHLLMCRSAG